MSSNESRERELERQVNSAARRILETLGSSSQQEPIKQESVSAAATEALNSKLQPLVEDLVRSKRQKDSPPAGVSRSSGGT